jgi:hypothetical protein
MSGATFRDTDGKQQDDVVEVIDVHVYSLLVATNKYASCCLQCCHRACDTPQGSSSQRTVDRATPSPTN